MSDTLDPIQYLAQKGLHGRKTGSRDEFVFPCFLSCSEAPDSKKRKLYINARTGYYQCKVCESRGGTTLLLRHFGDETETDAAPMATSKRLEILDAAAGIGEQMLLSNEDMLLYLLTERGLSEQTIVDRRLGFIGGGWGMAEDARTLAKASRDDLYASGLVYRDGPRAGQDFFYDHLLIPYLARGRVVQMRGRAMGGQTAGRYMTGPGEHVRLYGEDDLAFEDVILTEGEFDAMILAQHLRDAPDDAVSRLGVIGLAGAGALPDGFDGMFDRQRRVYVGFDTDDAGAKGAERIRELLGAKARVIELPLLDGKKNDWTEFFTSQGGTWREAWALVGAASGKRLFSLAEAGVSWRHERSLGPGIQTGFTEFDAVVRGMRAGQLAIVLAKTGCLAGDTEIAVNRGGKGFRITIEEMFKRWSGTRYAWDRSMPTYCQRADGGSVRLGEVGEVWESGAKFTYTVTTETGRTVRATDEHPFLTSQGWKRLDELEVGDEVLVNGGKSTNGRSRKPNYYIRSGLHYHPFAGRRGVKSGGTSVPLHRLVKEAELSGVELGTFVGRCRTGDVEGLTFLDPAEWAVHHFDHDPHNNEPSNLKVLSHSEHARLHASEGTTANVLDRVLAERVVSVEPYGEEMTYDISMVDEPHNFMANGFAVHNTGKTVWLCNLAYAMSRTEPVLFISLEQTKEEVYERMRRIYHFHHPSATEDEMEAAFNNLLICDENRLDERAFAELVEEFEIEKGVKPRAALVDYLGYYARGRNGGSPYEKVSDAVMQLKSEAKKHRLVMIAPHQVNRTVSVGEPIELDDARDSGVIEETGDFVLSIWRADEGKQDAMQEPTGKLRMKLLKSRHGGAGRAFTLQLDLLTLAIVDDHSPAAKEAAHHCYLHWRGTTYEDLRREQTKPVQQSLGEVG